MRNLKRVLSLSLALVMILGLMVVGTGASAADFTDSDEIVNEDAVNTLVALNIIAGKDDGSYFDPTGIVTRGEMAKMITIALNGGNEPVLGTGTSFSDTANHWASAYIEYCVNLKIAAGRGNGTFDPNATVTATEAAKMLLVAMNYDPAVFGLVGDSWDIKTNTEANKAGLYEDLENISASAGLTRDNAAQMIYNAILAKTMKLTWNQNMATGEITQTYNQDGFSIFADKYDGKEQSGVLSAFDYNSDKGKWTYTFDGVDADGDPAEYEFTSDVDYTDLFAMNSNILYTVDKKNNVEVYGVYEKDSSVLAEGLLGDIGSIEESTVKFDGVKYKFDAGKWEDAPIVAFGSGDSIDKDTDHTIKLENKHYDCKLIDNDNDGKVDVIVAHPFTVAKVTYVGKTSFKAGTSYTTEDVTVYDGIAKNDFVKIVEEDNSVDGKVNFTKVETVVEGKVTGTKSGEVKIDGTWYKLAAGAPSMSIGNSYDKAAVVNGYIFTGETSSSAADVDDYAVVAKFVPASSNGMNGDQAKLLFSDGNSKIVDTKAGENYADLENDLVTWKIEDDEYVLAAANTSDKDKHGFDGYTAGAYEYKKDGKSTIDSKSIADDAVIFVKDGTKFKTVTGAELKKVASITVTNAYYSTNDNTGFDTIVMAYVDGEISSTSDLKYGYITSNVEKALDDDDNTVDSITFWNGSETVTLQTKYSTDIKSVTKGSFFSYKVNGDNEITNITKITDKTAITAYDGTYVVLKDVDSNAKMEITDDTVILYVDSDGVKGAEGGSIELADKDEHDAYINNVAYVVDTANDEVTVLFIDVNNEMK